MKNLIYQIANKYVNFSVEGKKVRVPYCIVAQIGEEKHAYTEGRTNKYKNYAGKGTPEQIQQALYFEACNKHFNLRKTQSEEINRFMVENGIGVDCYGFVYHVLDEYLNTTKGISLDRLIFRFKGPLGILENLLLRKNRVRRISAATLTSILNCETIHKVKDIQPGDMFRLTRPHWPGKHIAIVVGSNKKYITYGHASESTIIQGPHFAQIEIKYPNKGLKNQRWLEVTRDGKNYGKDSLDLINGDGIRRLKYLAES